MFWRLDALFRFLLERMDDPDFIREMDRVNDAESIAPECQSYLEDVRTRPRSGFAMSALPPSAVIVSAVSKDDCARSGKASKSFSAALIHETGLVFLVSAILL
jgi:hypothetical protein